MSVSALDTPVGHRSVCFGFSDNIDYVSVPYSSHLLDMAKFSRTPLVLFAKEIPPTYRRVEQLMVCVLPRPCSIRNRRNIVPKKDFHFFH